MTTKDCVEHLGLEYPMSSESQFTGLNSFKISSYVSDTCSFERQRHCFERFTAARRIAIEGYFSSAA
jgi:hypothetical protein